MEPRTDSSASLLLGCSRPTRGLRTSSATRAISPSPPSRDREGRRLPGRAEDDNAVENENGSSPRIFPCHFGIYLHRDLWTTMWTIVNPASDKTERAPRG